MSHKFFQGIASVLLALALATATFNPALAAPPGNDNFANAQVITALPFSSTVDMAEASVEPNEPASCTPADRTVWYAFTPSDTILVRMTSGGTGGFKTLTVFQAAGPSISDLQTFWCPLSNPAPLTLEAGQTYYIQAGLYPGQAGTVQLNMEQVIPPANDNFADAEVISTLPFSPTIEISDAWYEPGEIGYCNPAFKTVWYALTPAQNMMVSLDLQGSQVSGSVATYEATGSGLSELNFLGCSSYASFSFLAEATKTYYLQVGGNYDAFGTIQINLRQIFPPPNDNFDHADSIPSVPFSATIDKISDATTEFGEQQWCVFMDRTVWYSFTPTQTVIVRANTQGSAINNNMNIYQSLSPGIGGLRIMDCVGTNESFTFLAEAGQTYAFQVGAADGQIGNIQINLEQIPPPANDNFAQAVTLSTLPSTVDFDTSGATLQSGEPVSACGNTSPPPFGTIWYTFTPVQNRTLSVNVINSNFSPFWAIYRGSSLNQLTEVTCGTFDRISFQASAGQTYYIQVGGQFASFGTGSLTLEVAPLPQVSFSYYPSDPSKFDAIQFQDNSFDPAHFGLQAWVWNFGDGTSANGSFATHKFPADGDYQVTETVTTPDGRTASTTQTVQVRTHDVAITKVTAPNSASVGQTRPITVNLRNTTYPESVQIDLYKSVQGGFQWVATVTVPVRALSGNRTTAISFNYTFTSADAKVGKVTFKVVATIVGARDVLPADNQAISSPATKVVK
jgi:PKD domain-containing protein